MSTPRRLRMSTLLETRDGVPANKDSRLTNCILEMDGSELNVIKRPGFTSYTTPTSGIGYGATSVITADNGFQILSFVGADLYTTQVTAAGTFTATGNNIGGLATSIPMSVLYYNNKWWLFNVCNTAASISNVVYSSTTGASWTTVTSSAGYNSAGNLGAIPSVVYAGKMWVVGGSNGGSATRRVLNSTDGATWSLVNATPAFTARDSAQLVVYNNKLWLISGSISGTGQKDVWSTTDGSTWTQATSSAAFTGTMGHASFVLAGKMWKVGGYISASGFLTECYYSTDGVTWTLGTNSPGWTGRAFMSTFVLNGYVYLVGGIDSTSVPTTAKSDMWKSVDGVTWTQVTSNIGQASCRGNGNSVGFTCGSSFVQTDGTTVYQFGNETTNQASSFVGTIYTVSTTTSSSQVSTGSNATMSLGGIVDLSQTLDRTQVAIKNTTGAWVYTIAGQTLAQVTDADYPQSTVRGLVYLDGTFYVMDSGGTIYGTGVNDFTTCTASNTINAQSEPDGGVCIFKYNQYVVAFGNYTTEFFYDAGNPLPSSPLSPVQNSQLLIGCANGDTVQQISSSVIWVAQAKSSGQSYNPKYFVAQLQGMSYNIISNPNIDRILNADGLSGAYASFITILGHPLYNLILPTTGYNLIYDMKMGSWYIFTTGTAQATKSVTLTSATQSNGTTALVTATCSSHGYADGDPITIAGANQSAYNGTFNITYVDANTFTYTVSSIPVSPATGTITALGYTQGVWPVRCAFSNAGTQVYQDATTGALYNMSETVYTDNSVYIDTKARFEPFDKGLSEDGNSQNKFLPWMDYISDKTSTATNAFIRWSDDDYQTYSNYRAVDISQPRSRIARCGAFVRRGFEIRHTASSAHRFKGFDLGLGQGVE